MEKAVATHSSTLAWKIPWVEGRSLVGYSPWGCEESERTERLHFHFSLSCLGEGNGNPLQCSCLENPRDGRAWWAAISGVAQSNLAAAAAAYLMGGIYLSMWVLSCSVVSNSWWFYGCRPPCSSVLGIILEYWSKLWFPSPGDLPDPGIGLTPLASPALAGRFFTTEPPGKPLIYP